MGVSAIHAGPEAAPLWGRSDLDPQETCGNPGHQRENDQPGPLSCAGLCDRGWLLARVPR